MVIRVEGRNLPGARCNPSPGAGPYENIHVGPGRRFAAIDLVRGDAPSASWRFDVRMVAAGPDGEIDFRGPLVDGKRGDRFLYLNWGTVDEAGSFHPFRRAKVCLSSIDPGLARRAAADGADLACTVDLTDAKGNPTCARFRPPEISWSLAHETASA
jgi:hypothetical protein